MARAALTVGYCGHVTDWDPWRTPAADTVVTAPTPAAAPSAKHAGVTVGQRLRQWLAPLALVIAALGATASVSVYLVPLPLAATVIAWAAVMFSAVAALVGMVAAVIGPHRVVAGLAVVIGLLSNPFVLWGLVTAAQGFSPY